MYLFKLGKYYPMEFRVYHFTWILSNYFSADIYYYLWYNKNEFPKFIKRAENGHISEKYKVYK